MLPKENQCESAPIPVFKKSVNVIFSIDKNYVKFFPVVLQSLITNSSVENNYDILVLYTGMDENQQKAILSMVSKKHNFSIRFFAIDKILSNDDLFALPEAGHLSLATYFRFFIADIFIKYERVLYLDTDIVINDDVAKLFYTDLGNYPLGACLDQGLSNLDLSSPYYQEYHKYMKDTFGYDDFSTYFNAGILLIDIKGYSKVGSAHLLSLAKKNKGHSCDQDNLNPAFQNNYFILDPTWNFQWHIPHARKNYREFLPENVLEFIENFDDLPAIIHYTTPAKPWNTLEWKFASVWWEYARKTPFYEEIIFANLPQRSENKKEEIQTTKKENINPKKIFKPVVKFKLFGIPILTTLRNNFHVSYKLFGFTLYKKFLKYEYIIEKIQTAITRNSQQLENKVNELSVELQKRQHRQTSYIENKLKEQSSYIENNINEQNSYIDTKLNTQNVFFEKKMHTIVAEESSRALTVYNLHQQVFPKYKNIHQGKDVVLVATGPSLNDYIPIEGAIHIGVNKAFEYNKVQFDYLFLQDFSEPTSSYINSFINYNSKGKFVGILNHGFIDSCLIPEKFSNCNGVERYYLDTLQQKRTFPYDITSEALGDAHSIAFAAMQFILWTHPKRIYLVGCDCSREGYYTGDIGNYLNIEIVLDGWKRLKEFINIYYPDIEVISVNPVGLKGIFNDITMK